MVTKGVRSIQQVLVKWSGWPASLATWEDVEALRQRFPAAPAWGQAGSLQGGRCYLHQQVYIPLYAWASAIYSAQVAQCACVGPRVATARVSGVRELRVFP